MHADVAPYEHALFVRLAQHRAQSLAHDQERIEANCQNDLFTHFVLVLPNFVALKF